MICRESHTFAVHFVLFKMDLNQSNFSIIMKCKNMVAAILNSAKMTKFESNLSDFAMNY